MSAARDRKLCKLASDAFKRSAIAWRFATPAQTHEWFRNSRIFIDAPPRTADTVNSILIAYALLPDNAPRGAEDIQSGAAVAMTESEAAELLGITLEALPTFPTVRDREALKAFAEKRREAAALWAA